MATLIQQALGRRGTAGPERGRFIPGQSVEARILVITQPEGAGAERDTDTKGSRVVERRRFYVAQTGTAAVKRLAALSDTPGKLAGADKIAWGGSVYVVESVRRYATHVEVIGARMEPEAAIGVTK